jgi:hypothetical protein
MLKIAYKRGAFMMNPVKIILSAMIVFVLAIAILIPNEGVAETPIFKDYQVVEVRPLEVPPNVASPDSAGRAIADEIVYQIRRYSAKFNLFEMVIMEGKQAVPSGSKVLLVKGTVTAYSPRGTCAVRCQFVDKASGQVLHETPAQGLTFRVGEYIAKVIYIYKVGGK